MEAHAGEGMFGCPGHFEGPLGAPGETLWAILGTSAGTLPASPKASQNLLKELILHTHLNSLWVTPCLQLRLHFNWCPWSLAVGSGRERMRLCHRYKPLLAIDSAPVISAAKIFLLPPVHLGCCVALSE